MAKRFYAVKNGRSTGIFTDWDECSALVTGFSGAEFKGFDDREDAEAYLTEKTPEPVSDSTAATAYVDGSYNAQTSVFSYGAIIIYDGAEVTLSESFSDRGMAEMRNVAGEVKGAEAAMRYCAERGYKTLNLYYDYMGIEKWCTGEWKANKPGTIAYKSAYDELKKKINVRFFKVKSHSGNKYNDIADALAKEAAGIDR